MAGVSVKDTGSHDLPGGRASQPQVPPAVYIEMQKSVAAEDRLSTKEVIHAMSLWEHARTAFWHSSVIPGACVL